MIEKIETRYGTMFIPDTDSGQYWWLKQIGASPEDEYIEGVCKLLDERERGTVVDVGANFGCWMLPLARYANEVIAIEPQSAVVDCLRNTRAANPIPNIRIIHAAAGAAAGSAMIPDADLNNTTNFGGISINIPHPEHPSAPLMSVPMIALDDVLADRNVTFIKADVEGSEKSVLEGAQKTIARCRPVLFVEIEHPLTNTAELAWFIESLGYTLEQKGNNVLGMPI